MSGVAGSTQHPVTCGDLGPVIRMNIGDCPRRVGEGGRGEGVCNLSGDMSQAQLHHPPPTLQAGAEDGITDG